MRLDVQDNLPHCAVREHAPPESWQAFGARPFGLKRPLHQHRCEREHDQSCACPPLAMRARNVREVCGTGGPEPSSRAGATPREGAEDGADFVACGLAPTAFSTEPPRTQLTPSSAARAVRITSTRKRRTLKTELPLIDPLENKVDLRQDIRPIFPDVGYPTVFPTASTSRSEAFRTATLSVGKTCREM